MSWIRKIAVPSGPEPTIKMLEVTSEVFLERSSNGGFLLVGQESPIALNHDQLDTLSQACQRMLKEHPRPDPKVAYARAGATNHDREIWSAGGNP